MRIPLRNSDRREHRRVVMFEGYDALSKARPLTQHLRRVAHVPFPGRLRHGPAHGRLPPHRGSTRAGRSSQGRPRSTRDRPDRRHVPRLYIWRFHARKSEPLKTHSSSALCSVASHTQISRATPQSRLLPLTSFPTPLLSAHRSFLCVKRR